MPKKASRDKHMQKSRTKADLKEVPVTEVPGSNRPKTAPPLSEALAKRHRIVGKAAAAHVAVKQIRSKKAVKVKVKHHATRIARTAARHYKAADAKAVHYAKRSVPSTLRERIRENRARNNGDLRIPVSIPRTSKTFDVVLPAALKHIRHAAVPGALAILLVLTMLPAGAAVPVYDNTWSMGGAGSDSARAVVTDGDGNVYTAGMFEGTVNFGADWGDTVNKTSEDSSDIFIVKQESNDSQGWVKRLGGVEGGASGPAATGGNSTFDDGAYRYHVFTSDGSLVVSEGGEVEWLAIGGGGAGGSATGSTNGGAGGGGAGGVRSSALSDDPAALVPDTYAITVGSGGTPGVDNTGGNTTGLGVTSLGGGRGAIVTDNSSGENGHAGASGGGGYDGSLAEPNNGGTGTPGQGHDGGSGSGASSVRGAGGGGGAGGTGGNAGSFGTGRPIRSGGLGGAGLSIWGLYDVGGGGGGGSGGEDVNLQGIGSHGGGNGAFWRNSNPELRQLSTPGQDGTGGGGGGGMGIDFPNFADGSRGGDGIFVVRYQLPNEEPVNTVALSEITVDSAGNVFVLGTFTGTINFADDWSGSDAKVSAGSTDVFVTKINDDGSYGWTRTFGGTGAETAGGLTVDDSGNVFVAGSFTGTVLFDDDFGGSSDSKESAGSTDAFVTKINDDNTYGGTRIMGGTGSDEAVGVVWQPGDPNGFVSVVGTFNGTVNFGADFSASDIKASSGGSDVFVMIMEDDGTYFASKTMGGSGTDTATAVIADASSLYVAGTFAGTVNFADDWSGTDSKTSAGDSDAFVARLELSGTYGWVRQIGAENAVTTIHDMTLGGEDVLYLAGAFDETVDFAADIGFSGTDSIESAGQTDAFITQLETDGGYGWTRTFGDEDSDVARGVAYDSADNIYVVGDYAGTVNFAAAFGETDEKISGGNEDAFIVKLAPAPVLYTITDAAGLTFEDEEGVNLSSTGTATTNPDVYIRDQGNGNVLAVVPTDLSENRDWSGLSGDSNAENAMFIAGAATAPGSSGTYTLYVPRESTDRAVYVCPDATALIEVTLDCANLVMYTTNDPAVSTTTHDEEDYFTITGITGDAIGAQSLEFPPLLVVETDDDTTVVEGGADDYILVSLQTAPTDDVTVSLSPSPGGQLAAIDPVTFTTSNWMTPVQVTFTAVDDADIEGPHAVVLDYAMSSTDANYDGYGELAFLTVNIIDNDSAGIVWTAPDTLTSESGDTAELCVALTARPTDAVTLAIASTDTSEVTVAPASLEIAPEDWDSADNCVMATGVDDDVVDGPQQADIQVTSVTSDDANFDSLDPGELPTVTITNQDNDAVGFIVTPSGTETGEDGTSVDICITLTARPAFGSVTIPVSVSDSSEGSLGSESIVIAAANWNQTTNCVTVTGVDDSVVDGDIEYDVITGNPTADDPVWDAAGAEDIANVTLTNIDNDVASFTVTETGGSTAVSEDGATDQINIAITSQPAPDQEVVIYVQPDSQLDVGEGGAQAILLTFTDQNWNDAQTVTVSAVDDALVEGDHTGVITVGIHGSTTETPYAGLSEQTIDTVAITDNDTAEASIATQSDATENPASNGEFLVSLSAPNNTGGTVNISYTVNGTATAGTHYTPLSGTVAIADGQDSAVIEVDVGGFDNDLLEGNLSVVVTLTSADSPVVTVDESADQATLLIFDDETATASIATTQNGQEADEVPVIFTVTLDTTNNTGAPISMTLSDEGGTATVAEDYESFAGSVEIPDGEDSAQIIVNVIDDALFEPETETVIAGISSPSLGAVSIDSEADEAEATITDNDIAEASITTQSDASENPAENGVFEVSLDKTNHTGSTITVNYDVSGTATPDEDYAALSGTVNILNGQNTAAVIVDTGGFDDDDMEGDETVVVTLTGSNEPRVSVGATDEATVVIADDEVAAVTVHVTDDTTSEDGDTAEFCISLASRPADDVTVALSVSDADKISVQPSIVIERGSWDTQASNCVAVTGLDDSPPRVTGNQTVTVFTVDVTSNDPFYDVLDGGDVDDVTITHTDNDTAGISVQIVSDVTSEDGSQTAIIRFRLDTQPSDDVTLALSVSDTTEGALNGVNSVTFTPASWNDYESHEVIVEGVDDNLIDGDVTYQLQTGNVTSDDTFYDALGAGDVPDVWLTNLDDDEPSVTITPADPSPTIAEGGAPTTHEVVIGTQPAGSDVVVVTVTPSNNEINLGQGAGAATSLTFTNADWDTPQTVTITATDDALFDGTQSSQVVYAIDAGDTTETPYIGYGFDQDTFPVTVEDNEAPNASLSAENGSEEGPVDMVFTVELDLANNTGSPVTFTANISGGSATAGDDYEAFTDAEIAVPHGASSAELRVAVIDDDLLEGDETLEVTLAAVDHPAVSLDEPVATATIVDNDETNATVTATTATAAENPAQNGEFTVSLERANLTGGPIAISYSVGGTATPDSDYAVLSGNVSVIHGQDSATITVDTAGFDDDLIEGNETVIVTLDSADHPLVSIGSPDQATVTIVDDDEPSVTINPDDPDPTITEGGAATTHEIVIGTQPASGNEVVVMVVPDNDEVDLGSGPGQAVTLTFTENNWDTPQTVTISPHDDDLFDGIQTVELTYSIDAENTTETPYLDYEFEQDTFLVTVEDNETAEAVLTAEDGGEAGPTDMVFTVTLDLENNTGEPVEFTANITGGTATPGDDYASFTNAVIAVPDGASTAELHVAVIDDNLLEGNETVEVTLTAVDHPGVNLASPTATATIVDDDEALATIVATQPTAAENPAVNGEFTVYLDHVNLTGQPISIGYSVTGTATPGEDYASLPGSILIPHGESSAVMVVDTQGFDDDSVEGDETVIVTLDSADHPLASIGIPASATVTIVDDDGFTVNIATTQHGSETGPVSVIFTVSLSSLNETGQDVTVEVEEYGGTATSGEDYEPFGGTVTIPDGQQSVQVVVTVIDDDLLEGTETIGARIVNPSDGEIGVGVATAQIEDNETGEVTIAATQPNAAENPTVNGEFTIYLSATNQSSEPILVSYSVNGTATAGEDYATLSGTAMIASGLDSTVVIVNTDGFDDDIYEGDETVVLTLTGTNYANVTVGEPSSATVTITDDETPPNDDTGGDDKDKGPKPEPSRQIVHIITPPSSGQPPAETPQAEVPAPQPVDQVDDDGDKDGISDAEEDMAFNNGDGNGDGIPDKLQPNVASRVSSVTGRPVTLEALGECTTITKFDIVPESDLTKRDPRFTYPHGLVDYTLGCDEKGQSAQVTIYYDRSLGDVGSWRKFSPADETFAHMDITKILTKPVGPHDVTAITYSITDGGEHDDDGEKNGEIRDPAGFAKRTFYLWDFGWIVPVLLGAWFIGLSVHHRRQDHKVRKQRLVRF